ncbi:Nucleoredoxin [Labeo rohita]|uniref:Nucleoredoxin n=1 Tax=Labeo rohita TaxID=84645 RepID=A0ABQ8M1Y1_LABRO|nr:Nucleoredoxin [Labeo rohita]
MKTAAAPMAMKLWNKYKVTSIPSLVFIDATTGKVVCRNGLLVYGKCSFHIRTGYLHHLPFSSVTAFDIHVPSGSRGETRLEFPWGPKPFAEVVAGPLLRNNRQTTDSSALEGSYVGVYFSAHWCPPCRSLTRVLVESYRKVKESGQKFEIVFVSADRSEESFTQYFSEMPWLAVPYTDEARRSRLNRLYGIQEGHMITRQGRVEILNDPDCRLFPWHPRPVLELSESNAVQLHEGPCLVLFVDAEEEGELEPAKELIQPIAEKIMAKYKAKEEETPLLFFVAGEGRCNLVNTLALITLAAGGSHRPTLCLHTEGSALEAASDYVCAKGPPGLKNSLHKVSFSTKEDAWLTTDRQTACEM